MVIIKDTYRNEMNKVGLFDKFKKKNAKETPSSSPKINPDIHRVFNGTQADMREKIFYGDVLSAQSLLLDLSDTALTIPQEHRIDLVYQVYLQVWIRSRGGMNPLFSTPSYIKDALVHRFSGVPKEVIIPCVEKSLKVIYQHEPELGQKATAMEAYKRHLEDNTKNNIAIQDTFLSDPEYGLVISKPVFVAGFGMDKEYLSHLVSDTGDTLTFNRLGSSEVEGISGPVDIYQAFSSNKKLYKELFVCVYGTRNTQDVPKGFMYKD